ncbi:MAG: M23 family metallopeptidase [Calditrichia bacterium]
MVNKPRVVIIDSNSSKIKQVTFSFPKVIIGLSVLIFLIGLSLKISVDLGIKFNHNSKISQLQKENSVLESQLKSMGEKITHMRSQVDQIEELDDNLRSRLDIPAIDADVRQVGIGGSDIAHISGIEMDNPQLKSSLINSQSVLARLEREIKLETESYKKLLSTMERKEDSLRYLPAIKPVTNSRLTDGFGRRRHPIFKRIMPHHGIDLAANRGTPVLATADGYVTFTGKNGGYGLFISINHKYGFETKYGHLQKIYVRRGQYVKRGEKIGEVGNTGISTAPHLHYEVHYHGQPVDPVDYYFNDLTFQ